MDAICTPPVTIRGILLTTWSDCAGRPKWISKASAPSSSAVIEPPLRVSEFAAMDTPSWSLSSETTV